MRIKYKSREDIYLNKDFKKDMMVMVITKMMVILTKMMRITKMMNLCNRGYLTGLMYE